MQLILLKDKIQNLAHCRAYVCIGKITDGAKPVALIKSALFIKKSRVRNGDFTDAPDVQVGMLAKKLRVGVLADFELPLEHDTNSTINPIRI